jgi:hypothetical protein
MGLKCLLSRISKFLHSHLSSKDILSIFLRGIWIATESITAKPYILQKFVANVFCHNIGKKSASNLGRLNEAIF